jgi:hypothetical protein
MCNKVCGYTNYATFQVAMMLDQRGTQEDILKLRKECLEKAKPGLMNDKELEAALLLEKEMKKLVILPKVKNPFTQAILDNAYANINFMEIAMQEIVECKEELAKGEE